MESARKIRDLYLLKLHGSKKKKKKSVSQATINQLLSTHHSSIHPSIHRIMCHNPPPLEQWESDTLENVGQKPVTDTVRNAVRRTTVANSYAYSW